MFSSKYPKVPQNQNNNNYASCIYFHLYSSKSYSGGRDIKDLVSFIEGKSGKCALAFLGNYIKFLLNMDLSLTQPKMIFLEIMVVAKGQLLVRFSSLERGDHWLDCYLAGSHSVNLRLGMHNHAISEPYQTV